MTAPQTSSRLQLMQARFQQRQLQEKEQKLLQLYDQQQQRAHQIALRGSTGSNYSDVSSNYESFISNTGKVRQLLDEKRQTKGIDKSYPLEPLERRAHKPSPDARTNFGARRTSRVAEQQRESLSRECQASGRIVYRESVSREACTGSRGEECVDRGDGNKIRIEEVIGSESAHRNRIPSKSGPLDLERQSHLDGLPGEASPEKMAVRRTSQAERLKNASPRKVTSKKPATPVGGSLRQSTYMRTTKSASLKVKKLCRSKKSVEDRKTRVHASSQGTRRFKKPCHRSIISTDLKSTPLVRQVIRNKQTLPRPSDANNPGKVQTGKVQTIITKIENIRTSNKDKDTPSRIANNADLPRAVAALSAEPRDDCKSDKFSLPLSTKRHSIIDPENNKIQKRPEGAKISPDKNLDGQAKSSEGMEEGEGTKTLSIGRARESSSSRQYPTEQQKNTILGRTIELEKDEEERDRRSSDSCINRHPRRLSFELKRMLFERPKEQEPPLIPRRDSVESALRHFDSIGVGKSSRDQPDNSPNIPEPEGRRLDGQDSLDDEAQPRSWHVKLSGKCSQRTAQTGVADTKRASPRKKVPGASRVKARLEGRDSTQLPRIHVKTKWPAMRREIAWDSTGKAAKADEDDDDDEASAAKNFSPDPSSKRTEPAARVMPEPRPRKEASPYPSSRSPESVGEDRQQAKARSAPKSLSLKFLNEIAGDVGEGEPGVRRSSIPPTVTSSAQLKCEKGEGTIAGASRPAPPHVATSMGLGPSRGQTPSNARHLNKAKSNLGVPAPNPKSTTLKNITNSDDSLVRCKICNRRFSMERIGLHEGICSKTVQKKRKQFDTATQRAKGTEFESFLKKPLNKKQAKSISRVLPEPTTLLKSNWRRKHEDFINAIRSAKQMQAHLDSGGKLSDFPLSPPSDTSDYVKCPHCSRRFDQTVATRHIPKCNSIPSNKPAHQRPAFKTKF